MKDVTTICAAIAQTAWLKMPNVTLDELNQCLACGAAIIAILVGLTKLWDWLMRGIFTDKDDENDY
jgi:hypothetical protein